MNFSGDDESIDEQVKQIFEGTIANDETNELLICKFIAENYDNEEYWQEVFPSISISDNFFINHIEKCNLYYLFRYYNLSPAIIDMCIANNIYNYSSELENIFVRYQHLTEEQINKSMENAINNDSIFITIQEYQYLSCEFMTQNIEKLDWFIISEYQSMNLQFLIDNVNNIYWELLPLNAKMEKSINLGFISAFRQTKIFDNIGFIDIPIEDLMEYKINMSKKAIESIIEHKSEIMTPEQINYFMSE